MDNDLDRLLDDAMREAYTANGEKKQHRVPGGKGVSTNKDPAAWKKLAKRWTDPEHWRKVRTMALIHQSSDEPPVLTLLGNFNELIHDSMTARKWVRVEEPTDTQGTEYVRGDWYLTSRAESMSKKEVWVRTETVLIGLTLKEANLHCPDAEVNVRLEFGGIARVELAETTRFFNADKTQFLFLPAGLDVMEVMTLDSKMELRAELEL